MAKDKIIMLEYDEETAEFKTLSMHNFENQLELEQTGKKFPFRGKLRAINTNNLAMAGYVSDDYTWVSIELK